jgi:hypothetical protein
MNYCSSCGAALKPQALFCHACGVPTGRVPGHPPASAAPDFASAPKPGSGQAAIAAAAAVAIGLGGLAVWQFRSSAEPDRAEAVIASQGEGEQLAPGLSAPVSGSNRDGGASRVDFDYYRNLSEFSSPGPADDDAVWALVKQALPDNMIAEQIKENTGATSSPQIDGKRIVFWGICARLCGDIENDFAYTVVITEKNGGQMATVCFEQARLQQGNPGLWYQNGVRVDYMTEDCPSTLTDVPLTPLAQ